MHTLSRRSVLVTGASAGLILAAPDWLSGAAAQTTYTRFSATSPQGKDMLARYAKAVDIMMNQIPTGDPRHWDFQWYTHWIPGPQSPYDLARARKTQIIQQIYGNAPPTDPNRQLAELMWNNCQAHGQNPPTEPGFFQEQYFLPWHRYFVYYFEQIIRGVLQDASFALPYWDYLGGPPASASIPDEFRNPSSPLYRKNRNDGVNAGDPVDQGDGRSPLTSVAFDETQYIDSPTGTIGFCPILDRNPHGALHGDVGDGTNMGRVPTAAGDPVFWLHHCQIDRLWESWNRLGRPNPSWPDRNFVFANAAGGMVTAPVAGANSVAQLGYQYDNYFQPPGTAPVVASATPRALLAARPSEVRAVAAAPLTLGAQRVRTSLNLPAAPLSGARTMQFAAPAASRNLYLVLAGIMLPADPGDVVYNVYIDLPEGAAPGPNDPHYVGTLNFFHIMVGHGHMAAADAFSHHSAAAFNVTATIRRLQGGNRLAQQATVTLIPSGKPQSQPVVQQVQLVEK